MDSKIFSIDNGKVLTTSQWIAHWQSSLFGVNHFQVAESSKLLKPDTD